MQKKTNKKARISRKNGELELHLMLPKELRFKLKQKAAERQISMRDFVAEWIRRLK